MGWGRHLCKDLVDLAEKSPPYHILPSSLNSFERRCMHAYCESIGVNSKSFNSNETGHRYLVAWTGDEPAGIQEALDKQSNHEKAPQNWETLPGKLDAKP